MENKICIVCGNEYTPTYSKQQCCCRKCAAIFRAKKQKSNRILKQCETCGKEFYVSNAFAHRKYCSRECADKGRTTLIKKTCEICGNEFEVIRCRANTAKYCSIKCQRQSLKHEPNCICAQCGKPIHVKPYHLNNYGQSFGIYCSRDCLNEARKVLFSGERNHQYGLKGPLNASFLGDEIKRKNHKLTEIMVYVPEHCYATRSGRVKKHRLVVEQNYEKFDEKYFDVIDGVHYLKPDINVHHIDGNHDNNVIENLIPCTRSEHMRYHAELNKQKKEEEILKTAVLKQGELLGSLEVGNQQPSQPLTKLEGSETNS